MGIFELYLHETYFTERAEQLLIRQVTVVRGVVSRTAALRRERRVLLVQI